MPPLRFSHCLRALFGAVIYRGLEVHRHIMQLQAEDVPVVPEDEQLDFHGCRESLRSYAGPRISQFWRPRGSRKPCVWRELKHQVGGYHGDSSR